MKESLRTKSSMRRSANCSIGDRAANSQHDSQGQVKFLGGSLFGKVMALLVALSATNVVGVVPHASADIGQSVRTQSGRVRCEVYSNDNDRGGSPLVVCQQADAAPFPQAPISSEYGGRMNLAVVRANGAFNWNIGNIAGSSEATASDVVLNYGQIYNINGWTIRPSFEGTRFTYDATGHGMFLSVDDIYAF